MINGLESSYAYIVYFYISVRVDANALISSSGSSTDEGQDYEFATHVVKVKRSGQGITLSKNLQFTIQVYLLKLKLDEHYKTYFMNFPVIDVKSLWDMDSQEGSKMPFAVGSKFDHLSPEHGNNMQKKVYLLSSINCMTYDLKYFTLMLYLIILTNFRKL